MAEWQLIETAPRDGTPILVWNVQTDWGEGCGCEFKQHADGSESMGRLCIYHAHGEGLSYTPTGAAIVVWGGSFDDSTWEDPNASWLPDWWFRAGSEFEEVANPTHWMPLPDPPEASNG